MSDVRIRMASPEDLERLVALYQSAQRWLAENGSDQWAKNTVEKTRGGLAASIARQECYVAELDGEPIGMITVDHFADSEFWKPADDPGEALYVHRMVVDRKVAGRNIGALLLDWATDLASQNGKRWLRLDAWRTNEALRSYYIRQGFQAVRVVNLAHRGSGALFQRASGPRREQASTRTQSAH